MGRQGSFDLFGSARGWFRQGRAVANRKVAYGRRGAEGSGELDELDHRRRPHPGTAKSQEDSENQQGQQSRASQHPEPSPRMARRAEVAPSLTESWTGSAA